MNVQPQHASARPPRWRSLPASLLCVGIFSACMLLVWPVVELATDDDFSYAKTAHIFAQTGHIVYNGWATAMLGWQIAWGALFIRLFGFSFLTLRLSVLVLSAATAFLLHRVMLRCGISPKNAAFGTLTVVLCPLFIPMAASFMTDVPAMLCILICLYGCQRALRSAGDRTALLWLCGSAALNVADGTVRQIAWLGALVMVPSAFWLLRQRRGFKWIGFVTWLLSIAGVLLLMRWFLRQPYSLPEHIIHAPLTWTTPWKVLRAIVYGPPEVLLFMLPVLAAWLPELRTVSRRRRMQLLIFCACATPLLLWADHYGKLQGRLPPWSANVISRYGILWSVPLLGLNRPEILGSQIDVALLVLLGGSILGFFIAWRKWRRCQDVSGSEVVSGNVLSSFETWVLILPFCVSYFLMLLPRGAFPSLFSDIYDRYYLPLIMLAVILLLLVFQRSRGGELPVTCYFMLLLFSFFGVVGTHDVFIAYRAIAHVRAEVEATGVPPAAISGPWELDGTHQIEAAGYMNEDRLVNPPGSYHHIEHPPLEQCFYWFGPLVPALHFKYVLTIDKFACMEPSQFPDTTYRTWLPPYTRNIFVMKYPNEHRSPSPVEPGKPSFPFDGAKLHPQP